MSHPNSNDLLILIQQDRKDLADLTRDFAEADKDTRANRADKATSQVVMMVNGANTIIHPPLKEHVEQGVQLVNESLERLKNLTQEFDELERIGFDDANYPSVFDRTFNRFFDYWDAEDRATQLLRDVMRPPDFELLGPRWLSTRTSAPSSLGIRSVRAQQDQPTLSQRMHQLLNQAQEMLSKAKISSEGGDASKVESRAASSAGGGNKLECGCIDTCTCTCGSSSAKGDSEGGNKLSCGCTGTCTCSPEKKKAET
ncbi:hypothetical protein BGZ94_010311 [Podila epigama]|nr:hypothetical protein BGZ94_010311 [Podila epigama]